MTTEEKITKLQEFCGDRGDCEKCPLNKNIDTDCVFQNCDDEKLDELLSVAFVVNHPKHYSGAHECIEVMRAMFGDEAVKAFCRCNSFKYRFRAAAKNGAEDIKKAEWYENYLIEMESGKKG